MREVIRLKPQDSSRPNRNIEMVTAKQPASARDGSRPRNLPDGRKGARRGVQNT